MSIHDQIKAAMERLGEAYAAKTGIPSASWSCEVKLSSYDKPQVSVQLQPALGTRARAPTVVLFGWDLPERTIDAAFAVAEQRIAALRTIDDENADLGIEPTQQSEVAA